MAEKLKRTYDLLVLKVELLDPPTPEGDVLFTFQSSEGGTVRSEDLRYALLSEMGLEGGREKFRSPSRGGELPVSLPHHLLNAIASWINDVADQSRPLWIHLVKPYGLLRLIPWEHLLGERLEVPILMLPDFIFPPPRETSKVLDVVICASAPLGVEDTYVRGALQQVLRSVCGSEVRRMRIHVFVDREIADEFRQMASAINQPNVVEVRVHDAARAERLDNAAISPRLVGRPGELRSPWLRWMAEVLRNRSVDVVHFVCHGYLSRDGGALLLAESPAERTQRFLSAPVSATELQTFLTRVGAWSSVYTAPFDNHSPPGLRALADEIAQSRPGPLMMHTSAMDPQGGALREGYRFLYGEAGARVPHSPSLFIYCQPYLVTGAERAPRSTGRRGNERVTWGILRNEAQRVTLSSALESPSLDDVFAREEQVPSWVASTERFADQVQLQLQELSSSEVLPERHRALHTRVKHQMLRSLRDAVAEEARGGAAPGVEVWGEEKSAGGPEYGGKEKSAGAPEEYGGMEKSVGAPEEYGGMEKSVGAPEEYGGEEEPGIDRTDESARGEGA